MDIILINGSSTPLYEQIMNAVKKNILENKLLCDEQLPSVRELSSALNVSILTVKKAYDELEKEGFITIKQGLGTFVAPTDTFLHQEEKQKELESHIMNACRLSKSIRQSKEEFFDLIDYIYGGNGDE